MTAIPIKGDRSAHDSVNYPSYHAKDLEDGTPIQHLPQDAEVGEAPVWDGTKYVSVQVTTAAELETAQEASGIAWTIQYNEVSPQTVLEVPAGYVLISGSVHITQAWDGVGAFIKVGVSGSEEQFFAASDLELTDEIYFDKHFSAAGPLTVIVTFDPGTTPSTGQATIVLETTLQESL